MPVAPDDSEEALAASPASPVDADEISVYVDADEISVYV